jgi:eukaryotic-like serine/threonine-protein kinase
VRYFGDYELLEEIAHGGMGIVYRARQLSLNRVVAVKMILAGPFATDEFIKRFQAEAQAAANLQHPNIVAIHEVGEHEGQHYFSMDYVEGQSLASLVRDGPLPAARAARYVQIIAEAIHYAHQRGILHRDLKPSNVLIDGTDQPRITDFGLAKRLVLPLGGGGKSLASTDAGPSEDLTLTGQVLGSPGYLPPEQATSHRGDMGPPSDVYSLGAILYHLLTGRPPFQGETLTEMLEQVLNTEPVRPRLLNPSIPRDLETVCLKCLEKSSARRYPTAQALADELGRFLRKEPIRARPASWPEKAWRWYRRNPKLATMGSALVLALIALAVGSMVAAVRIAAARDGEKRQRLRAEDRELEARQNLYAADMNLVQEVCDEGNFGRTLGLLDGLRPKPGEEDLRGFEWRYFWDVAQGESLATLRGHGQPITTLAFSPDGKTLASGSNRNRQIKFWDLATRREMATWSPEGKFSWLTLAYSPDGKILAVAKHLSPTTLCDAESREVRLTLVTNAFSLAFSPQGALLATAAGGTLGESVGTTTLWNYRTGEKLRTFPNSGNRLAFSPDGKILATGGGSSTSLWDPSTGQLVKRIPKTGTVTSLALSPDGRRLAMSNMDGAPMLWDVATGQLTAVLTGHTTRVWCLAFSPDGKLLATASSDQTIRLWDMTSPERHAQPPRVLRGHGSEVWTLAFSPDGKLLATGSKDGTVRLWSTAEHPATDVIPNALAGYNRYFMPQPVFSPDCIALVERSGTSDCTVWDTTSAKAIAVCKGAVYPLALSSNAAVLTFLSTNHSLQTWEVRTRQTRTSIPLAPLRSLCFAGLSPDRRALLTGQQDGTVAFWDAASGKMLRTCRAHTRPIRAFAFSPDSQVVVSASEDTTCKLWSLATQQELATLSGHRSGVFAVAFSPDGTRLATGSIDNTIKLWDVASRRELTTLAGHKEGVFRVAFSADGKTLASASDDRTVKLWHLATHREIITFKYDAKVFCVAFAPTGDCLLSATVDGALQLRHAPPFRETDAELAPQPPLNVPPPAPIIFADEPHNLPELSRAQPALRFPPRDPRMTPNLLDLSPFYNAALAQDWLPLAANNLADLPQGLQKFDQVEFDIRGLIQVSGSELATKVGNRYPASVRGLRVNRKVARLHFLHATGWVEPEGIAIGAYVLHYADGNQAELPIIYGEDVLDWWNPRTGDDVPPAHAVIVWTGSNEATRKSNHHLRLFKRTWDNPRPDVLVTSIDFTSTMTQCAPFLIAITVE